MKNHEWTRMDKNVDKQPERQRSAEGTAQIDLGSTVPPGRTASSGHQPNVETLGYCQTSLWDEYKILAASGKDAWST